MRSKPAGRMRAPLRILCAAMMGALALAPTGCALWGDTSARRDSVRFIVMADPQFGMTAAAHEGVEGFGAETALFGEAVEQASRMRPDFVVILGDLVNERGNADQTAEFIRIAGGLDPDIPLHLVAGNHDVDSAPTQETLNEYRQTFGADWYSFDESGCHFAVINSCLIGQPNGAPEEAMRQMDWLRRDLAANRDADFRVVFMHHPVCLTDPAEEDGYFVLPMEQRAPFLRLLREENVSAVFSGHYHRNEEVRAGSLDLVTSAPVGMPIGEAVSGFRVVEIGSDGVSHAFRSFESLRQSAVVPR